MCARVLAHSLDKCVSKAHTQIERQRPRQIERQRPRRETDIHTLHPDRETETQTERQTYTPYTQIERQRPRQRDRHTHTTPR